ncbi:MAG TPA: hypothetical protein VK901_17585 [Nitrospiraceae bacterium]|nr:hypothetical protein [Nitrospiraceae bacterium]
MKFKLVFALFPLILLGMPIYAQIDQSLCLQCLTRAKEEMKTCLAEAISHEDKTSCAERKEARTNACEEGECKIEKAAESGNKTEGQQGHRTPKREFGTILSK